MRCPDDDEALRRTPGEAGDVDACPRCHGIFIRHARIAPLLGVARSRDGASLYGGLPLSKRCCPDDGTALRVLVHRGATLDACPVCRGIWLDAGEYAAIAAAGASGRAGATAAVAGGDSGAAGEIVGGVIEFAIDAVVTLFD